MPQQSKCYCNSIGSTYCNGFINCLKGRANWSESIFSVASKNNKQKQNFSLRNTEKNQVQKTHFVKLNSKIIDAATNVKNRSGLRHSYATHNNTGRAATFSRRNSAATTVTFSTPPPSVTTVDDMSASRSPKITKSTSIKTSSPIPAIKFKSAPVTMTTLNNNLRALSIAAQGEHRSNKYGGALQHEYTEQRRTYESVKQLMKLVNSEGQHFSSLNVPNTADAGASYAASDGSDIYTADLSSDTHRLLVLQKFRLKNADDCFSIHRQLDLRLPVREKLVKPPVKVHEQQQIRKLLSTPWDGKKYAASLETDKPTQPRIESWKSNVPNEKLTKKEKPPTLTPYAVRQKLLQLRREVDEIGRMKPGRKLYTAMGNSFALRYQES